MKIFLFLTLTFISNSLWSQRADFNKINFHRADSLALAYNDQDLSNLPILAFNLTASLSTDVEKFRSIYTWVCTNIENDYYSYLKNRKNREKLLNDPIKLAIWNNKLQPVVFSKLLKEQKTVCTGYAYLVSELSSLVGINCKIINGYGRTINANVNENGIPNHSWNAVQLNNKWYLCDATWSSGSINTNERRFIQDYNDGYFLSSPELFITNHYPLDTSWMLTEKKLILNEFLERPLVYKHTFSHQILPISPTSLLVTLVRNETFVIILNASEDINRDKFSIELIKGNNSRKVIPEVKLTEEGLFELNYIFTSIGKYDVHLMFEDDYLASYTLNVKNRK